MALMKPVLGGHGFVPLCRTCLHKHMARSMLAHPVTLNRWELAGNQCPKIEGMPWNILVGLQSRLESARSRRAAHAAAARKGEEVGQLLAVGGVLVALAALLAFLSD